MTELFPAIDLRGGRVVRLLQGDYGKETVYGDDPIAVAESFVAAGAPWVHVVDLDAARSGDPVNRPVIAKVAAVARIQTGGGVRSLDDAKALADAGVARAVMGTAALRDPALVAKASEVLPVAVGLDHRGGELAAHGWTEGTGLSVLDVFDRYPTAAAFVITDIARDGMLEGPDVEGLRAATQRTSTPIIASGGVSSLGDIDALVAVGVAGVITGKALYEGKFTVAEALERLR
ncbi:MAG: 1-(5-phosphoribosyl)-5-[(5-phosphoribosylamino)methylideneamino]imidazole-4-carboxamide isomerase [Acidimicrobiia bacterium]